MSVILGRLSGAFLLNCELFALTLLFALPLGLVVAFGSMSRCRVLSGAVKTFVWVIRGTPLMLQIIVIYLGPGLLGMANPWPSGSGGRMVAAVVAFAINYACSGAKRASTIRRLLKIIQNPVSRKCCFCQLSVSRCCNCHLYISLFKPFQSFLHS